MFITLALVSYVRDLWNIILWHRLHFGAGLFWYKLQFGADYLGAGIFFAYILAQLWFRVTTERRLNLAFLTLPVLVKPFLKLVNFRTLDVNMTWSIVVLGRFYDSAVVVKSGQKIKGNYYY